MQHNVLAIIPARIGSQRFPKKNIAKLAGHTLVEWAIAAADSIEACAVVSTDSEEIASDCDTMGIAWQWQPTEVQTDTVSSITLWEYILREYVEDFDISIFLEPSCPLRLKTELEDTISKVPCCTVSRADDPVKHFPIRSKGAPTHWVGSGWLYHKKNGIAYTTTTRKLPSFLNTHLIHRPVMNIDYEWQLSEAEALLEHPRWRDHWIRP